MTKSITLLTFICVACANLINCQVELGVKGGFTHSWPGYGDLELPEDAQTSVSGYNISLFVSKTLSNQVGVSFQPTYVKKGAACFPGWQPTFAGDSKVFLNYLEFPFLVNRKVKTGLLTITPSVGYGFSVLQSASLHIDQIRGDNTIITSVSPIVVGEDSDDSFNKIDHGFYLSLRFDRQLMQNHFVFFESAYYHGMKDYDKVDTSKTRNLNFNFGFGYFI